MATNRSSFRIGRVAGYRRGRIWYLRYFENGKRCQPRVGQDHTAAKQLAAEINAQLEVGAPSALGFEPITIVDMRQRWLDFHEHVRRSSLGTIRRYRAATQHLVEFLDKNSGIRRASELRVPQATEFVRYLRTRQVAPNGHRNARKRRLLDAGVKYVLETCCTLFNYAQRNRHLPPYVENPFRTLEVCRIPNETSKPVVLLNEQQELEFFRACDDWQFRLFLTLRLTGLRSGELVHLLLPENLDLEAGWLRVRNKPRLGWQVKTRNERDIPLLPIIVKILRLSVGDRQLGPVFRQRRCDEGYQPPLATKTSRELERELDKRIQKIEAETATALDREGRAQVMTTLWRDLAATTEDWIGVEFRRVTERIGLPEVTAPKLLRHAFATTLQDANVDPLVRNELMGHAPNGLSMPGGGLGMTAIYTHTRPETKRRQLEAAFADHACVRYAEERLQQPCACDGS